MFYKIDRKENLLTIEVQIDVKDFNEAIKRNGDNTKQETVDAAVNELISSTFNEIVYKEQLDVASYPKISLSNNITEQFPFAYIAEIEVMPANFVKVYKGFNLKQEQVSVSEQEINHAINEQLSSYITYKEVDKSLENGDRAIIDFLGKLDGVPFDGGKAENYELVIGSNTFVPGFESQLVGMKLNETRNINIKFPDNYVEHLAGKDVVFEVTLHKIKEAVYPSLSDELIKSFNINNVSNVTEYRKHLENKLLANKKDASKNKVLTELFKLLKENNPTNLPNEVIKNIVDNQENQLKQTADSYKLPIEVFLKYSGIESIEQFRINYTEIARNELHEDLILKDIIKLENIDVTQEEIEEYYNKFGEEKAKEIKQKWNVNQIKELIAMQKCVDFLYKENFVE